MINIITSFYIAHFNSNKSNERNNELRQCLNNNLNNNLIEKIHLYIDDNEALEYIKSLNNNKINIIAVGFKPLYSDFFSYSLNNLQNKICMITNSDIYLGESDVNILNKLDNNTVYSLTRYEHDMSSPLIDKYEGSHDCFIFKSPINFINNIDNVKHVQHVWGSENVVLYELNNSNIKIYNPCYQIKIIHLHQSDLREENRPRINYERSFMVRPSKL